MDKLLSAASGERIRCIDVPWKDTVVTVTVSDNNTDILKKCSREKPENEWEADTGWLNKWGYQSFGIERYKNKRTNEFICVYTSDYNKFYVLNKTSPDIHAILSDLIIITLWEGLFWPSPFNASHQKLRDTVGPIAMSINVDKDDNNRVKLVIYTDKYIFKTTIDWDAIQFVFTVVLTKVYDCYTEEVNTMFQNYGEVFNSIKYE